jgi:predicted cupin superfamily sugar epimerase
VEGLTAAEVIAALGLSPLPGEGGYYREMYRAGELPSLGRAASTAIYYLLTPDSYSALHVLLLDEVYHFYRGDPVDLTLLHPTGELQRIRLGSRFESGESPQAVVPSGVWQGSRLVAGGAWALLGTTVAPGFTFADCTLADARLLDQHPEHADAIRELLA